MSVNLSLFAGAGWQFFDNNGIPLAGGLLYTYAAGTTTPAATYTTNLGNVAQANPIVLDSSGRVTSGGEIWLNEGLSYKFVLKDANNVLIGTYDNINGTYIANDLANTSDPSLGDALVGFRQSNASGNLTGAVGKTVHQKFQEFISVLDFGADNTGATDCSNQILACIVAANGKAVYFPGGTYKFSVQLTTSDFSTRFYGDASNSTFLIPLSSNKPCFIFNFNGGRTFSLQIENFTFQDLGSQTSCGVWTDSPIVATLCNFNTLKYGIIGNNQEWSRINNCTFSSCYFGVYATTAVAANDPLGIQPNSIGVAINPSEWFFDQCWWQGNQVIYYENQPDSAYDKSTNVYFSNSQFLAMNCGIITIDGLGAIKLLNCWFEGHTNTISDLTINGKVINNSIIYTQGASIIAENVKGFYQYNNPIYMVYSNILSQNANNVTQYLYTCNCDAIDNYNLNIDEGIPITFNNGSAYSNGGTSFSKFTNVNNVTLYDNLNPVVFPSPNIPINVMASGGALTNLWTKGTCADAISQLYGSPTASIQSGDGFYNNSGFKYLQLLNCISSNGVTTGPITTITNYFYVATFAIRQASGSDKNFGLGGFGDPHGLGTCNFVSVPGDNVWRFYTYLGPCSSGGAAGAALALINVSGSTLSFDLSCIQLVAFPTNATAQQFIKSSVYVNPVVL